MTDRRARYGSLVPLVLIASGAPSRCELSTDSGTGELRVSGTVHFIEVDGGCWQLDAGEGRRYELLPDQAPTSLLRHGTRASVVGHLAPASETGCSVGLPLAVRRIVSLEPGPTATESATPQ
ncbi:MAG TPA: hypothetical protein VHG35_18490 [Gemmatimonadales bacterium]|nr:hypothetical protein [Gemmatimonadales bacterium]